SDSNPSSNRRHLVPSESGNLVTSPLLTLSETDSPDTNECKYIYIYVYSEIYDYIPPSQRHSLKLSQLHAIDMGGHDSDSNSHCALLLHDNNSAGGETPKKFSSEREATIGFLRGTSMSGGNPRLGNARTSRSLSARSSSYELSDLRKTQM
ncbi:hypothetical protein WDU94_002096, partial [Cyamophila willieti]